MNRPDFFIVGAPKCGTSALFNYLVQHPEIYGSSVKEPCYFGSDLQRKSIKTYENIADYEKLYQGARDEKVLGEASTWYLYSQYAAKEIKEYNPDSKIIIMLRDPVEVMYSLYEQLVKTGDEEINNFVGALNMEVERKKGKSIPDHVSIVQSLYYREVVRFGEQVERYFDIFGRSACKVILFEDFKSDTLGVYKDALSFLNVDTSFNPSINIINKGKQVKSLWLHQMLIRPGAFQKYVKEKMPVSLRRMAGSVFHGINTRKGGRRPLSDELSRTLRDECAADIKKLGHILNKDLKHWVD